MKVAARVLAPLVAVATLASCSPSPRTAAIIDGVELTESQVTSTYESCQSLGLGISRPEIAGRLIIGELIDAVAARLGHTFNEAELQAAASSDPTLALTQGTSCQDVAMSIFKTRAISTVDPNVIKQVLEDVEITMNPRYGQWDPTTGIDLEGGSISVPERSQS